MSEIEKHMIKATKFNGKKYEDRQVYLGKLLEAVDTLSRGAYEKLCDQLDEIEPDMANTMIDWLQEAVAAKENDREIPELPDIVVLEHEPIEDEVDEPSENPGSVEDDEAELEAAETADAEEAEAQASVNASADEADGGDEGDGVGDNSPAEEDEGEGIVPTPKGTTPKKAKPKKAFKEVDYSKVTGEKDKYGIVIGTKTHEAVKMYEKGCTAAELMEKVGGRHYNILTRLINEGHKVQKLEGGVWRLTHKDALKGKKK